MTEKIRQLENRVHFAGALAELKDVREGVTKAGVPYLSFSGVIQCGESQANRVRFRTFVKSKKNDGTDSKNFAAVKKWVSNAVPMSEDEHHPTFVDALGSVTDNPYVNVEGNLVEAIEYNLQFFKDFQEYAADIDLEGFIHSIKEETKPGDTEETTGRQRMRFISRDFFGNTLDLKNIVVPEELVDAFADGGYEKGATAMFFITLLPNKKVSTNRGGIGVQRVDGGKPYLEMVVTGAPPVIDAESEKALDPKLIKAAMVERQTHLDEVKANGYLGNKSSNASVVSGSARQGMGQGATPAEKIDDFTDDDFPF